ncbi:PCC domain-containing protein, partial [Mycoplasma marinum]
MEYKKLNNGSIALKISIGEKIRESLTKLVADEAIKFAKIEGVGAIENVTLGFLQENGEYKTKEFKEELELLSMKGSIAGDGEIHLHVTLGK